MVSIRQFKIWSLLALIPVALAMPETASAVPYTSYTLSATATTIIMADGRTINAWAFADVTPPGTGGRAAGVGGDGAYTVPGPVLEFPANTPVTITVTNDLAAGNPLLNSVPTSLIIPGQFRPRPVQVVFPLIENVISGKPRVRSFSGEIASGGSATYSYTLKPGTFLYESGTNPQVQIPMGLYGAVIVRPAGFDAVANKIAYPGVNFDVEAPPIVISEIDPALHSLASLTPLGSTPTTLYTPKYYLMNGKSFPQTEDIVAGFNPAGTTRTLIRILNAGSRDYVPTFAGNNISIIAEDGNLRPVAKKETALTLPAGKTYDLILETTPPAAGAATPKGYFPLYDRALGQTNNTIFSAQLMKPAGMMTFLGVYPVHTAGPRAGTPQNCSPLKGDVNGDGKVTIGDALLVLRKAVGITEPVGITIANGNVFPVDADTGLPCGNYDATTGDDVFSASDALLVLQKAVGANPY